jgi:DNA-binding response OmpR family regulator
MRRFGISNENGQTILLVEENECLRTLIREYLEANGFEVKAAPDSAEAMRLAALWGPNRPDLLLTNVHLGDASGSWLAGMLRGRTRERMAVVYLVNGELNMETLNGSDLHVQKPFSFLQLHAAVDEAMAAALKSAPATRPGAWIRALA